MQVAPDESSDKTIDALYAFTAVSYTHLKAISGIQKKARETAKKVSRSFLLLSDTFLAVSRAFF